MAKIEKQLFNQKRFFGMTLLRAHAQYILSINEKLPLLKFRYFENYKWNLDSYFVFRVSGQLQTRLEP